MGLRIILRNWNDFATKTEFGIASEYFCEIGLILRLGQNLDLSWKIFVKLKLDVE